MQVILTKEMILALQVAVDEFDNGSEWRSCFDDENDIEKIENGIEQLRKLVY